MPLIVGLGNPGKDYALTRHNAGFIAVDALAIHFGAHWKESKDARAQIAEINVDGKKIILAKPQTFMNLSGEAVGVFCRRWHLLPEDVWVIYDEASLELGTVRLRQGGSAGGHNGVKSIIQHLGENFWRIRIGINLPPPPMPLENYVLQRFSTDERQVLDACVKAVTDLVEQKLHDQLHATTFRITT